MAPKTPLKKRIRRMEVAVQRNPLVQRFLRSSISAYVRLVHRTTRWTYLGLDAWGPDGDRGPALLCVWHETLPGTTHALRVLERDVTGLASDHADGMLVVAVMERMGFGCILVNTSRDKTGSLREAVRRLRRGGSISVTPDGPLGPAGEAKPGAVTLAALAGVPMIPFGYATRPCLRLPTWDRMMLPLPFGRGVLSAGDALHVPRRLDEAGVEAESARLAAAIDAEMARCAEALG